MIATKHYTEYADYMTEKMVKSLFNYGVGAGIKYSFTQKFGVFVELSTGKYFPNENKRVKLGLAFKL
jgi:hypothetical protein